ncbi:AraC family transcriptional regulator [Belliella sp. DSM 111904]|uniref:AraC family transcriptional regulator n=1 Tax=Belliella filtrata TaxID=2923435 RepID=A0ABS9V4M7_9BACT|nr:AraC family transcriptional regulator [Belliella filtrata]MCH7411366.1 AraC family transcriptional regulator [Belliella filtrata]
MEKYKIHIKYMVSLRCIIVVKEELNKLGIKFLNVSLGEVEILGKITKQQKDDLSINLKKIGLELLDDKKSILIEKVKNEIITMIHHSESLPIINFSDFLTEKLEYDYTYLSNIFTEVQGITIQQFIIYNKIEKVKELLVYDELNLTEISYLVGYSSVAHLSNQFKKVTGLTPSFFKHIKQQRQKYLKNI